MKKFLLPIHDAFNRAVCHLLALVCTRKKGDRRTAELWAVELRKHLSILLICLSFPAFGQTDAPADAQPRIHRYVDTSRPVQHIESEYPYDISVRNVAGDTLLTNDVFSKNGKPTVVLFWLTTCAPCRHEMNAISGKYAAWQSEADFNFYAVSVDFPRNFPAFQKKVTENNWPFPVYHDMNREFRKIMPGELNGLPQVFLLNKEGEIVYHKRKYVRGDEDTLFKEVQGL